MQYQKSKMSGVTQNDFETILKPGKYGASQNIDSVMAIWHCLNTTVILPA